MGDDLTSGAVPPAGQAVQRADVPPVSSRILSWFASYGRRYAARHFHAVRVARDGVPGAPPGKPAVVVLNHPSWWDPIVGMVLAMHCFPERRHFAPIDAEALSRYRFLGRIGLFPVERGTRRGASRFLRTADAILRSPDAVLWITAQGEFRDPRERPVRLRTGVGHLAGRLRGGAILPLALEYPFWEERLPEALARFGPSLVADEGAPDPGEWTERIERALEHAQDALGADARARKRDAFETIVRGRAGVGGIYDLWRRAASRLRGERFRREHGAREP